jgi:hypothetical protein
MRLNRLLDAGQRRQKNCLDPGEDRRVGANAQSQRGHHDNGEAWPLYQHSQAVSQILPEGFHDSLFLLSTPAKSASHHQERAFATSSYDAENFVYRHSSRNAMQTPMRTNGQTTRLLT